MAKRSSQSGFTLVEVLVALIVFSAAAISLLAISRSSATSVKTLEDRYIARTIADSKMAETFTDVGQLQLGDQTGEIIQMDREFTWLLSIVESGRPGLDLIRVQVSRKSDGLLLAETVVVRQRNRI